MQKASEKKPYEPHPSIIFFKLREQRCCTCNKTTPDSRGWHVQYKTPNTHEAHTVKFPLETRALGGGGAVSNNNITCSGWMMMMILLMMIRKESSTLRL